MQNELKFTLLGTASSGGVPRIGNDWGQCNPDNPKNRRRRCALLIERISNEKQTTVLIDTGADMREQMLSANVEELNGVLITHAHADHIFGLDDLRQMAISLRRSIDVYMDEPTSERLMRSFSYCFYQSPDSSYPAFCNEHRIESGVVQEINGDGGPVRAQPLIAEHGDINALGFRIGKFVYLPDIKTMSDRKSLDALQDTDVLVIDSLRRKPHPTHMNLDEALAFIGDVKPRRAILTNMHSDLDYDTLRESLPSHIEPGYDGMCISFPL